MTFFCVRSDTRQIFDAVGKLPSDEYLRDYSELYGCEIRIIEGTTVKSYDRPTTRAAAVLRTRATCPSCTHNIYVVEGVAHCSGGCF